MPLIFKCSNVVSYFFEVQGMVETTTMRFGSMPSFSAHHVLYAPPECICGERAMVRFGRISGA